MFSSRIVDTTNNCNIIKHSLCDDLLPYTLVLDNTIVFSNGESSSLNVSNSLDTMITASKNTSYKEVWQPLFISNDNYIQNKLLSPHGSCYNGNLALRSGRLGIENFLNFVPSFKSWNVTNRRMCIDWLLNGNNIPYAIYYGIMCWFKIKDTTSSDIPNGVPRTLDYFPNGSRLKKSNDTILDQIYIKINNNQLYATNSQSKTLNNNGDWTFNDESTTTIIEVNTLGDNPLFILTDNYSVENIETNQKNTYSTTLANTLWIPDGDCFFFHNNEEEKTRAQNYRIPCRSYISPSLHQKYSLIYRILTLDEKRSFNSKNLKESRIYKRLAHALSTSPFIHDFAVEALDSEPIKRLIQDYIRSESNYIDINFEINDFKTVLLNISRYLQNTITNTENNSLYLDTNFINQTLNTNLVSNKSQLLQKLITKYGAYLRIEGPSTRLTNNSNILKFDNKGIAITQVYDSYCNKNLTNTPVANSQKIIFDNTSIETKLNEFDTNIEVAVDGVKKTTIPLYDAGKPLFGNQRVGSATLFCPLLVYKGEVPARYRTNGSFYNENAQFDYIYFTPIDDYIENTLETYNANSEHCSYLYEHGIELKALSILGLEQSYNESAEFISEDYLNNQNSFFWEQIYGPPGTFGKNEMFSGITNEVIFYTKYTGKYIFQCTISSPFGTFKKQKTIYVVDGRELIPTVDGNMNPNPKTYGTYWDPKLVKWVYPPAILSSDMAIENRPFILDKDGNKSTISTIDRIAISNYHGIVWPIKTNFSVRENVGDSGAADKDEVYTLSKDYIFNFNHDYIYNPESSLSLIFYPNNTIIKLYSIYLEKIRTDQDDCSQCLSLYLPKIRSFKKYDRPRNLNFNRTIRTNKNPEEFTLRAYVWDPDKKLARCIKEQGNFRYRQISTSKSPKIKSYGGYSRSFIDSLGININGIRKPLLSPNDKGIIAASGASPILSSVTGFPLDYRNDIDKSTYKLCYQKAVSPTGTGLVLAFDKGVFHPSSGWIAYSGGSDYRIHANRCGILKFNPGARESFAFIGPQINQIKSGAIDIVNNKINSKIFSSSITLGIAKEIQWDPECSCDPTTPSQNIELYNNNQKHKDYVDIYINNNFNNSNHGYRILAGGQPKAIESTATTNYPIINDEFLTDQTQTNFSYSFAVTGPNSVPEKINLPDGRKQFRIPRVNGFGIKDIEVKLNFLNYVNTKNMVIWLDVNYSSAEGSSRFPQIQGIPPSPLKSTVEFLDQTSDPKIFFGDYRPNHTSIVGSLKNNKIENYLIDLIRMNSPDSVSSSTFKLFLLNQETIQNNGYNFSVKFSDSASNVNVPCDMNLLGSGYSHPSGDYAYPMSKIYRLQNIIRSNNELLPTVSTTGYSDREWCEYSSIIHSNKLNISNNTFSKFVGDTLFRNVGPNDGPCPGRAVRQKEGDLNGTTTFTLNIMVLDEEDDMRLLDSTLSNKYIANGLESTEIKSQSHLLYNSLCNWELILHVGSTRDPLPYTNPNLASYGNNDVLSLIDYKKDPSYPGYSFISDLSNYKHLLPLANYNAPYSCISDSALCLTSQDDPTGQGVMVKLPKLAEDIIVRILAGLAAYAGMTGGNLIGALAGLELAINNPAYGLLFDYFKEVSFTQELSNQGRQIYSANYAKYPFGSPEKMLINFRKPDSLWYTAEATIFKYHNLPVLKPQRYNFLRLATNETNTVGVDSLNNFKFDVVTSFQDIIDKKFTKNIAIEQCQGFPPNNFATPSIYSGVLLNDGDIINATVSCQGETQPASTYIVQNNQPWLRLNDNIEHLNKATHYLQYNNILSINNTLSQNDLVAKKIILIPSRIPYDLFRKDDALVIASGNSTDTSTINKKGLIFKDNKYYSLLVMDRDVSGFSSIAPSSGMNILLVYKNQTTVQDKKDIKYNIWGMNTSNNIFNNTIDILPTTHSVGSYGDQSVFVNKNILSNNFHENKLETIYDIFNNKNNDKIKHNNIKIFRSSSDNNLIELSGLIISSSYGFCYSKEDINESNNILRPDVKNKTYFSMSNDVTMTNSIEFSSAYNEIPNNFALIRLDTDINGPGSAVAAMDLILITNSGELEIENCYYEHKPIETITTSQLQWLTDRLLTIENTGVDASLERIIGIKEHTLEIINKSKLNYINKHYATIEDDPIDCYTSSVANRDLCYKQKTYAAIKNLYEERNSIIQLLNDQTIVNTGIGPDIINNYQLRTTLSHDDPRRISPNILPKIQPIISGINWQGASNGNKSGPIYIEYKNINENHYIINIDPKQSCFQDFESNPKVLISTKYKCIEANPILLRVNAEIDNNICPFFTNKPNHRIETNSSADENITSKVDEYIYSINQTIIDRQKQDFQNQYPAITGWRQYEKIRYFNINGDQTMDNLLDAGAEVTVESTELYYIPLTNENQAINDNSGDTIELPGIPACQTNFGSPAGKGLIRSNGSRIGKSTRVCNIVNLDSSDHISVKVKKIPRLLRGVDLLSTVYRYGNKSEYRPKSFASPPVPFETDLADIYGNINNSMYLWVAFQRSPSSHNLEPAILPDFFKLQNEMVFRSFFGSVDKIENKTETISSNYPWELIPYEYDQ